MATGEPLDTGPARRQPRWAAVALVSVLTLCGVGLVGAGFVRGVWAEASVGLPPTPDAATMPVSTVVVDRNGQMLRPYTTNDGLWRLPVTLKDVDRRFITMLLAYEDRHFESHHGVDWSGILRAAGQFVLAGEPVAAMGTGSHIAAILATGSSQPVLYIEFRKDGAPVDPGPWWVAGEGKKVRG